MIDASIVAAIRARLTAALAPPRGPRVMLAVDGRAAGWLDPPRAARLARFGDVFESADGTLRFRPAFADCGSRTEALDRVCRALAAEGALTRWRDERYAAAPEFEAAPWFLLERAAARYFGIRTHAAHANGLVETGGRTSMWIARRSPAKPIDPGMLDNLVGGGIAYGQTVAGTVVKESWEEAGVPAGLAARATAAGQVDILRAQPDGLHRETIHVHDLALPPDFVPACRDGEVVEHRLVPFAAAARLVANVAGPDVVTADASLVVVDCLLRHGAIDAGSPDGAALAALRHPRDPTLG